MQLWEIEPNPALAIKGRFQRDENGDEVWVLTAKRAWKQIEKQWVEQTHPEIYDVPQYAGKEGFSALKHDHEFQITKSNTDVIVYAKARTEAKRPAPYHRCRLLIDGHIDKTIGVYGPRRWVEHAGTLSLSNPQPFIETDIDYSFAIGGDERNRLGCGIAKTNQELVTQCVPAVFYLKEDWRANPKNSRVAGLGSVPAFFSDRLKLAGTFDKRWELERRPLLPEDFDHAFFQCAPPDQQCKGHLLGGERIMLSGCSHDFPLSFRVPSERYVAEARIAGKLHLAPMRIYTVFIDSESQFISITYSASFPCQGQEHLLASCRISQHYGKP